ncbi:MAG: hypothetical protein ACRDNM_05365 [Gaiellaceae bacterium]
MKLAVLLVAAGLAAPSPADATHAFAVWIHARYGAVHGVWTCPKGQVVGSRIDCTAEFTTGTEHHLVVASARRNGASIRVTKGYDSAWTRRWKPLPAKVLAEFTRRRRVRR